MIFDKMAKIAEAIRSSGKSNSGGELCEVIQQARVFKLNDDARAYSSDETRQLDAQQIELVNKNFFLPYPIISIEGPFVGDKSEDFDFCMVMQDIDANQVGVNDRKYIMCVHMNGNDTQNHWDVFFFLFGVFHYVEKLHRYASGTSQVFTYHEMAGLKLLADGDVSLANGIELKELLHNILGSINTAMLYVHYINLPCNFIVQDSPTHRIRHQKNRIERTVDRPIYTVLTPGEIKKRYAPSHETSTETTTRAPHERRRHLRTYTAECYKAMKGKQQWIPACWVGPSEFPVGRRIYKVMLEN